MDVKLPKLGEGAESGSVVSLLVSVGDVVMEGQTVIEVENEKAVAPIPATAGGTVSSIRVKEGDRVVVGQTLLTLGAVAGATGRADSLEEGESKKGAVEQSRGMEESKRLAGVERRAEEGGPVIEADEGGADPVASPSIRKLARQVGIDLRRVRGSARGGRIVLADLQAYVQHLERLSLGKRAETPASKPETVDYSKWGPVKQEKMSPLRQTISRRMSESWTNVPHVTQFDEADVTELMALRKKHGASYEAKGAKLTLTSFALKAIAMALRQYPVFNSSLDLAKNELVLKEYYHIGLAVDTEHGLMVPVIRDVDQKSLLELSLEVTSLAEKARQRKLGLEEMQGGTFTISNQGGIGGGHFTPIVNRPEVAILGLGRGGLKPVVREGKVEPRVCLPLAISYDHRVIDGGTAARFTVEFVRLLTGVEERDVAL